MATSPAITGVLLAGGRSRRLGRNKAMERFQGEPLLARVAGRLAKQCGELLVVVADPVQAEGLPIPEGTRMVADLYPNRGSLGGIYTGLYHASNPWAIVVACDMPFLNNDLLAHLLALREGHDAVVPVVEGRTEPTHALYSRSCMPIMRGKIEIESLKIAGVFDEVRARFVPESEVRRFDPALLSFLNINCQADLDRALALAAEGL